MGYVTERHEMDTSASGGGGFALVVGGSNTVLVDASLGDSIAVEGVCLTITEFDEEGGTFKVGVSPETRRKTNLDELKIGSKVNLERAVRADTRLGGHIVQGHVDTTVKLLNILDEPPNSVMLVFQVDSAELLSLIVPKGYVALDGVSLTVVDVDRLNLTFRVMLIAYTRERVTLSRKPPNSRVNLEVEAFAKYIRSALVNVLSHPTPEIGALLRSAINQ